MKRQHTIIILAFATIILIVLTAWGTIALLRSVDNEKEPTDTPNSQTEQKKETEGKKEDAYGDPQIDKGLDEKAKDIEDEAATLMDSDPAEAKKLYLKAADAYKKSGNISKVSEMQANAMTAELLVEERKSRKED